MSGCRHGCRDRGEETVGKGADTMNRIAVFLVAFALISLTAGASSLVADREMTVTGLIVTDQNPGPGFTDVEITGDLVNTASGRWLEVTATLIPDTTAFPGIIGYQPVLRTGPIDPFAAVPSLQPLLVQVPDAVLADFLAAVALDDLEFDFEGNPESLYTAPAAFVDEPTDTAFLLSEDAGPDTLLVFCDHTGVIDGLSGGDLLLVADDGYQPQNLDPALLPGSVTSAGPQLALTHCPAQPEIWVVVRALTDITDVLSSGVLSAEQKSVPVVGSTLSDDQYFPLIAECNGDEPPGDCTETHPSFPIRFNRLDLGDGLTLSGEIQLGFSVTALEISIRNAQLDRVLARVEAGWTASLAIEAEHEVTAGDEIQLFAFQIPIGSAAIPPPATPIFEIGLSVGAEANLAAAGVVGIHGGAAAGVDMTFENGAWTSDFWSEPVAAAMSPPQLTDATIADARGYVALDLSLQLSGTFGPLVRTSGFAELLVTPTQGPWWSIDAGVSQDAGTRLSFFGIDVDWTFPAWEERWTILDSDDGVERRGRGGARLSGDAVRWAAAFEDPTWTGGFDHDDDIVGVVGIGGGGSLVFGTPAGRGILARFDDFGQPVWVVNNPPGTSGEPVAALELPDETLLVAGQFGAGLWLRRLAADGTTLETWAGQCNPICKATDMVLGVDDLGDPVVALAGWQTGADNDPFVMLFEADPSWANWTLRDAHAFRFSDLGTSTDRAEAVAALADGGFALVGATDADVGTNQTAWNMMLMVVDGAGDLDWATAVATTRTSSLEQVAQGPDGSIFVAGRIARAVSDHYPAATVLKIQPDGSGLQQVLIAEENATWLDMHASVPDTSPQTAGGDTTNDRAFDLIATADGPVVVGRSGPLLGDISAWAFQLDPNLGAQWLSVFDGPGAEHFMGVAESGDGYVAVGWSDSWVPAGVGGDPALVLFKLPREGMLRLDSDVAGATRFLQPRVETASGPHFWGDDGMGGVTRTAPIPFLQEDLVVDPGIPPGDFVATALTRTALATPAFPGPSGSSSTTASRPATRHSGA